MWLALERGLEVRPRVDRLAVRDQHVLEVQREQLAQRRAYGLEILQTPDERRIREIFRDGRDPLPKEHK